MGEFLMWVIAGKTNPEIVKILSDNMARRPWAAYFCRESPMTISPNMMNSSCRLEPVPFEHCILDRFFYVYREAGREWLVGAGVTTRIHWDGDPQTLPPGWQGTVRRSYLESRSRSRPANTLVPLLAFTTSRFREHGAAGTILSAMCRSGQEYGFRYAIIPALPPLQFTREHAGLSIQDIAALKREDGQPLDYWIRLHIKKGAEIIGYCERSHRFALSLSDFSKHISSDPLLVTGYHVVRCDKDLMLGSARHNTWQRIYADMERGIVSFDWGCVWVRYDLEKLSFARTVSEGTTEIWVE